MSVTFIFLVFTIVIIIMIIIFSKDIECMEIKYK